MHNITLDQRRSDFMQVLYERSGRTCSTYTGLWQEFCLEVGANLRDGDADQIARDCLAAVNDTESHLTARHVEACMAVIRRQLLGRFA